MILKKCILTANDCYESNLKMTGGKPKGIVLHSTGANNPYLKRYVQPLKNDEIYEEVIEDIGKNTYGNHWNLSFKRGETTRQTCVHAFIGKNSGDKVETYQTLPFDICCWGVGTGSKGSYNYNPQARVQIELCEDGLKDEKYFTAVFFEAAEFCAYLCKEYGFGPDKICSHAEAYRDGFGSNHGDPEHWMKNFGKTMEDFRKDVQELLQDEQTETEICVGDEVDFRGKTHYTNSYTSAVGKPCKPGRASVTKIINAPAQNQIHTVHIKALPGGGSNVNGWVDKTDIFVLTDSNEDRKDTENTEDRLPYLIKVTTVPVKIRKGPGDSYAQAGEIAGKGVYTITEEASDMKKMWGRLKSGAGWICLEDVQKYKEAKE